MMRVVGTVSAPITGTDDVRATNCVHMLWCLRKDPNENRRYKGQQDIISSMTPEQLRSALMIAVNADKDLVSSATTIKENNHG